MTDSIHIKYNNYNNSNNAQFINIRLKPKLVICRDWQRWTILCHIGHSWQGMQYSYLEKALSERETISCKMGRMELVRQHLGTALICQSSYLSFITILNEVEQKALGNGHSLI